MWQKGQGGNISSWEILEQRQVRMVHISETYITESPNPLKCGKEPSRYWQLRSIGKVDVTTGTWKQSHEKLHILYLFHLLNNTHNNMTKLNQWSY